MPWFGTRSVGVINRRQALQKKKKKGSWPNCSFKQPASGCLLLLNAVIKTTFFLLFCQWSGSFSPHCNLILLNSDERRVLVCTLSPWGHTATHTDAQLHVPLTHESRDSILVAHTWRQKTTKQPMSTNCSFGSRPTLYLHGGSAHRCFIFARSGNSTVVHSNAASEWVGGWVWGVGGGVMHVCVSRCLMDPLIICSCRHSCCFRGCVCFCVHIKRSACGRAKTWPHIYAVAPAAFVYRPARSCSFQPRQNCRVALYPIVKPSCFSLLLLLCPQVFSLIRPLSKCLHPQTHINIHRV